MISLNFFFFFILLCIWLKRIYNAFLYFSTFSAFLNCHCQLGLLAAASRWTCLKRTPSPSSDLKIFCFKCVFETNCWGYVGTNSNSFCVVMGPFLAVKCLTIFPAESLVVAIVCMERVVKEREKKEAQPPDVGVNQRRLQISIGVSILSRLLLSPSQQKGYFQLFLLFLPHSSIMFKPLLRSTVPLIKAATRKSTTRQLKTLLVSNLIQPHALNCVILSNAQLI